MKTKDTTFEFVVDMGEGQLFSVKKVSAKLYSYALNRVRRHFPHKEIIIREVVTTVEHKDEVRIPANIDEMAIYRDIDDNGASYTVIEGCLCSTGQYLIDDPYVVQLVRLGVPVKDGIDNRTFRADQL